MDTTEMLKNLLYMAVGYASINQEKVEEFTNELMEKGKMTQSEGKKLVDDLVNKTKNIKDDLYKKVEEFSKEAFEKLHIASTEEINDLKKRLAALEEKVAASGK